MTRRYTLLLPILFCLPAAPALAQTAIGGGACTSSTLNGTYEFLLSGRQVTASGTTSKLFQGVGAAVFDGLSHVTLTVTANIVSTSQAFGTPLVYSGTYSLQSNCVGSISITGGDTGSFTVEAYSKMCIRDSTRTRPFTPRYASPEELRGERATTASDIFSLGVILYELLTGAWPFGKPDSVAGELNRAFSNVPVKAPATVVTAEAAESRSLSLDHLGRLLRGDLPAIALKALEADPARRYGTARQFSDDIAAYLEGHPVQARPQTALYRARKFLGRRWLPVAAAAVFVAAVSVAAVVSVYEARMARAEALKAEKVNQFLNDMLSSGTGLRFDPERFTVADMLQAAEPLLLTRWKDDPLTKALLQRSLGASYTAIHRPVSYTHL